MKQRKRLLSILLTLAMVVTLLPAATVTSHAIVTRTVTDAETLKSCLEKDTAYWITLGADIDVEINEDVDYWCTLRNENVLDLNGHYLDVSNNNRREMSTMFEILPTASLTVYDKPGKDRSRIHYDGYINEDGSKRVRNIFSVSGKLTVNGGKIEAGRSKSYYNSKYARTVYKQIPGSGILARPGSTVIVNGGIIYGRETDGIRDDRRNAGIWAASSSRIYFNNGEIRAKGGAHCFNAASDAKVYVMNGRFSCEKLDAITVNGRTTQGIGYGKVGIQTSNLGFNAAVQSRTPSNVTDAQLNTARGLVVAPKGGGGGTITPLNGDQITENGRAVHRLLSTGPQIQVDLLPGSYDRGYYFLKVDPSYVESYKTYYTLRIFQDGVQKYINNGVYGYEHEGVKLSLSDLAPGFTPEKGVTYDLKMIYSEELNGARAPGSVQDFYFQVVDDLKAPVITGQTATDVAYNVGDSKNLTLSVDGSNLQYTWQVQTPGSDTWSVLFGKRGNTLELTGLTAADNGKKYRCMVQNSAGRTFSQAWTLRNRAARINRVDVDIDPPIHGQPLAEDAMTTTSGCQVTDVQWKTTGGEALSPGYVPYNGETLIADVTVEAATGMEFAGNVVGYVNASTTHASMASPSNRQRTFSFRLTAKAPASGSAEIGLVSLEVTEPVVGSTPGYISLSPDGPYMVKSSQDARFDGSVSTWSCNGASMSMSDTFQTGKTYTVSATLTPRAGWAFTDASSAELNGEPMEVSLSGGKLLVSREFVLEEADPSGDPVTPTPTPSGGNPFVDVNEGDEYYEAVLWAYYAQPQITTGTDATHFSPKNTVKRCESVTFLWRAMGCPEPKNTANPFTDVKESDYFYKPVLWAVENNITKGTTATTFAPNDTLSTAHMITFLYRTKNPGKDGWYEEAANWAGTGYDGKPFGVNTAVNNSTNCPRGYVVMFLKMAD